MIAIHRIHNLETNWAWPISSQILVISEHTLFTLKGKELEIYLYCTVRAWTMPTLCLFLAVPWVGMQAVIVAFLGRTLTFFLNYNSC